MLNETRTIGADRQTNALRGKSGWVGLSTLEVQRVGDRVWISGYSQRRGAEAPISLDLDIETARALGYEVLNAVSLEDTDEA